ncbi:MAG TPA: recombination protein RecR [Acholeplasmataceae bacterium]|jgi:recombination protein RecR|nr:recombination protein RecR [Acholeplasmataceae bacterium]
MKFPESLENLIKHFQLYPGIGPKTAERLALFTISKLSKESVNSFSKALIEAIEKIKHCDKCGSITDKDICDICNDQDRKEKLMVVENSKDIIAFEKTNAFHGKYHVLNGMISPLNGVGPDDININALFTRVKEENIKELIIALPSTIPGEMTCTYIQKMLENSGVLIYRIGYGLPVGADIEYADEITLIKALEGIKKL